MPIVQRLRRSTLAVPGSSEKMMSKAATLDADEIFLDLEDSVAASAKADARRRVVEALNHLDLKRAVRCVRVNDVATPLAYRDIVEVVVGAGRRLDTIMVPKVEDPSQVHFVHHLLGQLEGELKLERRIGLEILIETTSGMVNIREIVRASNRIEALIFGVGDYSADFGQTQFKVGTVDSSYAGHQWHWAMCEISVHARAAGVQPIDGPYADFSDAAGYQRAAAWSKALGFEGKWCIHPSQLPLAQAAFSVSDAEYDNAKAMLEAYDKALLSGLGAIQVNGILVDEASRKIASRIVENRHRLEALARGEPGSGQRR